MFLLHTRCHRKLLYFYIGVSRVGMKKNSIGYSGRMLDALAGTHRRPNRLRLGRQNGTGQEIQHSGLVS